MINFSTTCWYVIQDKEAFRRFLREVDQYQPETLDERKNERMYFLLMNTDIERKLAILRYRGEWYTLFDLGSPFERYLLRKGALTPVSAMVARTLDLATDIKSNHGHQADIKPAPLPELEEQWYEIVDFGAWRRESKNIWNNDFQVTHWSRHTDLFSKKHNDALAVWSHFEEINGEHGYEYVKIVSPLQMYAPNKVFVRFTKNSPLKEALGNALMESEAEIAQLATTKKVIGKTQEAAS